MIQNQIKLFLRKALIACPFLLGTILLVVAPIAKSAALEVTGANIDPFPIQPTTSSTLYLDIQKTRSCVFWRDISPNKVIIDPVNRTIKISLLFDDPLSGFNPPGLHCDGQNDYRIKVIDKLPISGDYQVFFYGDTTSSKKSFVDTRLWGVFSLTIAPANSAQAADVPTLSEWMLIFMALALLFFATRTLQIKHEL